MSKMVIFISITKEYLKASFYVFFRVKAIKEQDMFKFSARTQVNKYSLIRKGSCAQRDKKTLRYATVLRNRQHDLFKAFV